jgi:hypothetical protein
MFDLFLSENPLRTLRPGKIYFFSRRGAEVAENFFVYDVLTPNTFAGFASWRE